MTSPSLALVSSSTPSSSIQPASTQPAATEPLFEVRGLKVTYDRRVALDGVDLALATGRVTALIGPSGCGKTTFLQCLNRLTDMVPRCRVEGSIRWHGRELRQVADLPDLRRRVGMIFQKPNPFPLSIRRNLELPLKEHGLKDRAELERRIEGTLRDVGLWDEVKDRLGDVATSLSGGQQQRLCLARALVLEPEALLMDEPTSALDPLASGVVEDLIRGLRRRLTVVLVTHNLAQARRLADDAAMFWVRGGHGAVIESGPMARLFEAPQDPDTRAYIDGLRG